jgi:hypothetical protein
MIRKVGLALFLASMASVASAGETCKTEDFLFWTIEICSPDFGGNHPGGNQPMAAPEIDPSSAMAGLALMAGGLAVLRGRRVKSARVR